MAWSKPEKPVCLVLLLLTNQLAGAPEPIPFRLAYFCHVISAKFARRDKTILRVG